MVKATVICYRRYKIFEPYHMFEGFISYLCVMILSRSLVTRYEQTVSFLCVYFYTSSLLASNRASLFFFMAFIFLPI
jgi:hypothetical protein